MDKRVREILHFFVAPPRVFPLSVRARCRASTDLIFHKFLHLSTAELVGGHYGSRKCGCYDKVEDVTSKELHLTYDE